jgi:hypothetical protein
MMKSALIFQAPGKSGDPTLAAKGQLLISRLTGHIKVLLYTFPATAFTRHWVYWLERKLFAQRGS